MVLPAMWALILSSPKRADHSVLIIEGEIVLTRILGANALARHLEVWIAAAFVTEYAYVSKFQYQITIEEPLARVPATEDVIIRCPPFSFALKIGFAACASQSDCLTLNA
jgi:hypothetical protein